MNPPGVYEFPATCRRVKSELFYSSTAARAIQFAFELISEPAAAEITHRRSDRSRSIKFPPCFGAIDHDDRLISLPGSGFSDLILNFQMIIEQPGYGTKPALHCARNHFSGDM
jgi:hypothetical protein